MKLLYLLRYYPTLTETFVNQELAGLAARGVSASVAAIGSRADGAIQDELPDLPVLRVPRALIPRAPRTAGERWLSQWQRPKDVTRLGWLRRRLPTYDGLHVHFAGEAAEWAAALHLDTGLPFTVTVHAADLFKARPSLKETLSLARRVLTVSRYNQVRLAELGVSATLARCGPDLARCTLCPLPDGPLRALFVGRNVAKKGLDTLLNAWAVFAEPSATLEILSDLSPSQPLPPGAALLGLRPPAEVRAALARCNLLVLPARRAPDGDQDGVPLVLMEALAMGRPVLSTATSGIPELVTTDGPHANGWLVPPDDPNALAAALRVCPAERARRGGNGPASLKDNGFTLTAQIDALLSAWR